MGGKPMTRSIYLPPPLADRLREKKTKINFSRVCQKALERALDETDDEGTSIGEVYKKLHEREEEIRTLKSVLQGIVRHAAEKSDMTVLSGSDEEAFREVFEHGVETFKVRLKKEWEEEAKASKKRKRRKRKKKRTISSENKAQRLMPEPASDAGVEPAESDIATTHEETVSVPLHTGEARVETIELPVSAASICPICNQNTGDVPCEGECDKLICWFCWGELEEKSPGQPKLCPGCKTQ
jgi:rRNA-processing protein FCF1